MSTAEAAARRVTDHETVWIPLADGTRLAARIWLPANAEDVPVPAVLEFLPYRRRDRQRASDGSLYPHLAAFGFACVRIDARGSGDSDGVTADEYTDTELDDIVESIDWIAAQSWCNGAVGMMGLSWSGFNALQAAARRPPALGAILAIGASDDRYANDMHYSGGCLLSDNLHYGATLHTYSAAPPDPLIVGDRWREMWLQRLDAVWPAWFDWTRHPHRDEYWQRGSVCEDYTAIRCPVMAVSGWADGYVDFVLRLLENLEVPRQGIIGPWAHAYPHRARPGPCTDIVAIAARWFDHWLGGIDHGVEREPMLRAWIQRSESPQGFHHEREGEWVALQTWPNAAVAQHTWRISGDRLVPESEAASTSEAGETVHVRSAVTAGHTSGEWSPYGTGADMPLDQRDDEGQAVVFTSAPLAADLSLLGTSSLDLRLASDRACGMLKVGLCDVAPDGSSRRISFGLLSLRHREGFERACPPRPGEPFDVRVRLRDTGYRVPQGHRLRVSLATACWPLAWPEPELATLSIDPASLRLHLPGLDEASQTHAAMESVGLPAAVERRGDPREVYAPAHQARLRCEHDIAAGRVRMDVVRHRGRAFLEQTELEYADLAEDRYEADPHNPLASSADIHRRLELRREDWNPVVRTRSRLDYAADGTLRAVAVIEAYDGPVQIFSRRWEERFPRD